MTKYLSGAGAARLLGVNEKTVRSWVRNGKLRARKAAKNRFDILAADVEVLRRERERSETPDISVLVARLGDLEKKYADLEQKYRELAAIVVEKGKSEPVNGSLVVGDSPDVVHQKSTTSASMPVNIPAGSMLFADFAAKYGIPRATFSHHVKNGIAGDIVASIKRPKPGRPDHMEYWLAPEQQEAALVFWERYGIAYTRSS